MKDFKPKKCIVCQKEFKPMASNQVYCSDKCSIEGGKLGLRKMPLIEQRCVICGKKFIGAKGRQCCSTECIRKYRKVGMKCYCEFCGIEFTRKSSQQIYCSEECKNNARKEREGIGERKTCPICGTKFNSRRGGGIYCSSVCAKRSKTNEWTINNPIYQAYYGLNDNKPDAPVKPILTAKQLAERAKRNTKKINSMEKAGRKSGGNYATEQAKEWFAAHPWKRQWENAE